MRAALRRSTRRPASSHRPFSALPDDLQRAGRTVGRSILTAATYLERRAFLILVNLTVAAIVVALPFLAATSPRQGAPASETAIGATSLSLVDDSRDAGATASRVQPQARGATIVAGRNPATAQTADDRPIVRYTLSKADSLWTIANFYGLSAEAIAFANGISDPYHLEIGRQIVIPPAEGALYTVAAGDTIEAVAARFKVDPEVIRSANRLYFEPERFAAGRQVFVQNAALPTLPAPEEPAQATVIARAAAPAPGPSRGGYLAWPVNGVITQPFWSGHTGVDIAAPYGSGLAASVSGVVSSTGWVAVGGLHVCIRSGSIEECYYHLSAVYVSPGQAVTAGQIVSAIGLTGVTTGPHVHWETKVNGQFQNPLTVQP